MPALETLVRHASGALDLIDATGLVERTASEMVDGQPTPVTRPGPRPLVQDRPVLRLDEAPRHLSIVLKPGRIAFLRNLPSPQEQVVPGGLDQVDLTPPPEDDFVLAGEVGASSRAFNRRAFRRTAGSGARIPLEIHRAPAGVAGPALSAQIVFDDGAPASWAIVTVRVDLSDGDPAAAMTFRAQADRRGQARIPLPGLPLPSAAAVAAGTTARDATVTVRALRAASGTAVADPDAFVEVTLRGPDASDFVAAASFRIEPARPAQLASFDGTATGDRLVLRQT